MPCSLLYLTALLIFSVLSSQPLITPPSPTVRHMHTHPRSFLSETKDPKINLCPSLLRLLPCWEETLVTDGKQKRCWKKRKRESQLRFYECNRIGVYDWKHFSRCYTRQLREICQATYSQNETPLSFHFHSSLLSTSSLWKGGRKGDWMHIKMTSVGFLFFFWTIYLDKAIIPISICLITWSVNLVPFRSRPGWL